MPFQDVLNNHPDMICRFDTNLKLTYANKTFAALFGGTVEDHLGKNVISLIEEERKDSVSKRINQLSLENPKITYIVTRNDRSVETTIFGIFCDAGTIKEYQSVGRDITEEIALSNKLKARNSELEAMQSEMRGLLDAMPCKVSYKDGLNNILRVNALAAKSMGLAISDIEGKNTYDLFGDSAKKYHEDDLRVINSGKPLLDIVERYTPNDGPSGWVKTDKIPFDDSVSGERRILVVSTDITRIKEQEAYLKALNQNLDDFASLASHDMQAPLRQVLVLAQLLERDSDLSENSVHKSYLDSIQDNVREMRVMIDSLLKFMRSKPKTTDLKPVNLSQVFARVSERHMADMEDIGATMELPEIEIFVQGDETLLEQVFNNLIENAIKYREFSRPLEISISAEERLGEWIIGVADNGVGVPPHLNSSIFEIFGRAKSSADREGYGIGLAICKRIVVLHGGTITHLTSKEQGAEFVLRLKASKHSKN